MQKRRITHCPGVIATVVLVLSCSGWAQVGPPPVLLWEGRAPGATGDSDEDKPAIYAYLPGLEKNTGAGVLVIPGGGFMTRVTDHEGVLVARWLQERGVAAFVLRYRIRPVGDRATSVRDAQRAMQFIRSRVGEYQVSVNRIGMIGFSAGAELATAACLSPLAGDPEAKDEVDRQPTQADFLILAYGSTNGTPAAEMAAPFPPTFMFCTAEDTGHINGMLTLYSNLRRARVPVEAHFFANGEHGVGLAHGDPVLGEWPNLMFNWMRENKFLMDQPRVAIRGMVKLDGEPLPRGVVVLTHVDSDEAPPIVAYVFNTGPVRGEFNVPLPRGAVPGKYRVEVRQYAGRWMSNSRDPFMVAINQKLRQGPLSEQDQKEWLEFVRARDLSPTIEDQRVFTKARPGDAEPMVVEITDGRENRIDLEVFSK